MPELKPNAKTSVKQRKTKQDNNTARIGVFRWFGLKAKKVSARFILFFYFLLFWGCFSTSKNIEKRMVNFSERVKKLVKAGYPHLKSDLLAPLSKKDERLKILKIFNISDGIKPESKNNNKALNVEMIQQEKIFGPLNHKVAEDFFIKLNLPIIENFLSLMNGLMQNNKLDKNDVIKLFKTDGITNRSLVEQILLTNREDHLDKLKKLLDFILYLDISIKNKIEMIAKFKVEGDTGGGVLASAFKLRVISDNEAEAKKTLYFLEFLTNTLLPKVKDENDKKYFIEGLQLDLINASGDLVTKDQFVKPFVDFIINNDLCKKETLKKCIDNICDIIIRCITTNSNYTEQLMEILSENILLCKKLDKTEKTDVFSKLLDSLEKISHGDQIAVVSKLTKFKQNLTKKKNFAANL